MNNSPNPSTLAQQDRKNAVENVVDDVIGKPNHEAQDLNSTSRSLADDAYYSCDELAVSNDQDESTLTTDDSRPTLKHVEPNKPTSQQTSETIYDNKTVEQKAPVFAVDETTGEKPSAVCAGISPFISNSAKYLQER